MAGALIGAHRTVMNYRLLAGMTRYDSLVERLREAARPDRNAPPEFAPYLDKVRRNAYAVTDEDIQALKDAAK